MSTTTTWTSSIACLAEQLRARPSARTASPICSARGSDTRTLVGVADVGVTVAVIADLELKLRSDIPAFIYRAEGGFWRGAAAHQAYLRRLPPPQPPVRAAVEGAPWSSRFVLRDGRRCLFGLS